MLVYLDFQTPWLQKDNKNRTFLTSTRMRSYAKFWKSKMNKNDQDNRRNACRFDLRRPRGSWSIPRHSLAFERSSLLDKHSVQLLINRQEIFTSGVDVNVTWGWRRWPPATTATVGCGVVWRAPLSYGLFADGSWRLCSAHKAHDKFSELARGVCTESCVCTVTTRELWIRNTMNYSFLRVF